MQSSFDFDGKTYDPALDCDRLNTQLQRVFAAMRNGEWVTLEYLASISGGTTQAVSARIRDFRKERFGGYTVERRRVDGGLFEYRLIVGVQKACNGK